MMDDWSAFTVHQLVHGYARGHELLGQSLKLSSGDLDEVARLSDLSGLQLQDETPPYLTCYPLPSGDFYAFGKTWIDDQAPRGGCVLTQTLLVPADAWRMGVPAGLLARQFALPSRTRLGQLSPLHLASLVQDAGRWADIGLRGDIEDFAARFFIDGVDPVIWPVTPSQFPGAEEVFLRLLDILWPAKRATFSGTTFALQPRRTTQGLFQVMLIPSAALGRFSGFPQQNVVGRAARRASATLESRSRRVVDGITDLLCGAPSEDWRDFQALRAVLPESSDALIKVATLEDLAHRGRSTPMAFVAALDVWAGLAPAPDQAWERKNAAIMAAIESAADLTPLHAIELLTAVLQRLRRPAFARLRNHSAVILEEMTARAIQSPSAAVEVLGAQKRPAKELLVAVARGLQAGNGHELSHLEDIGTRSRSDLHRLLSYAPGLVAAYLDQAAKGSRAERDGALKHILDWLDGAPPSTRRAALRSLSGAPAVLESEPLLSAVVGVITPAQLPDLLMLPRQIAREVPRYVGSCLAVAATREPGPVRDFYRMVPIASRTDAEVLCAAMETDADLTSALAEASRAPAAVQADLISYHVVRHRGRSRPTATASDLLLTLLQSRLIGDDPLIAQSLEILLGQADASFVEAQITAEHLGRIEPQDLRSRLLWWTFLGALGNALGDHQGRKNLSTFLEVPEIGRKLTKGAPGEIANLINHQNWSGAGASRAWEIARQLAPALGKRSDLLLADLIGQVFATTKDRLDHACVQYWIEIIGSAEADRLAEAVQSLSFGLSLNHRGLPVSPVVIASFAPLYARLPASRTPTLFDFWMLNSNWDKRKDFRRNLIDVFLASPWPPGDLALAANAARILPKIVGRLLAVNASTYVTKMAADLNARGRPSCTTLARTLEKIAASKDFDLND